MYSVSQVQSQGKDVWVSLCDYLLRKSMNPSFRFVAWRTLLGRLCSLTRVGQPVRCVHNQKRQRNISSDVNSRSVEIHRRLWQEVKTALAWNRPKGMIKKLHPIQQWPVGLKMSSFFLLLVGKLRVRCAANWLIVEPVAVVSANGILYQNTKLNIKIGLFTQEKLNSVLRKIKNRKAAGLDEIPPEVWKTRQFDDILPRHCNAVYNQNPIDRWMKGCILPFPKKGDVGLAKNYRGITLTSIAAKI